MLPEYVNDYLHIPFTEKGRDRSGGDCWAIPLLWYRERYGIELPRYTEGYATTKDQEEIGAMVRRERLEWHPVPLAEAQEGDLLILRMRGQPMHCAVIVQPPWFLHLVEGSESCVERWDSLKYERRIVEVLRHQARVARAEVGQGVA